MHLITLLKNIYNRVSHAGGLTFFHSVEEDEVFLQSFPEPKSDIERSFFQYRCQKWSDKSEFKYFISNLISAILIIPFMIKYRNNEKKCLYSGFDKNVMTADFCRMGTIPEEINIEAPPILIGNDEGMLTKEDLKWLKRIPIRRYGFFFYFKVLCRVAIYSRAIREHKPSKIFCSAEYSFTSSILTNYCEERGIDHINIMHGEKIFALTDAFSRFTSFYIWDEEYKELFYKLRANKTNYIILPKTPFLLNKCTNNSFTYYLQSETIEQLRIIKKSMDSLKVEYSVRPHPIYGTKDIYKIFEKERIENNKMYTIKESLNNTKFAISVDSTVLYEAYLAGRKVIIDDVSNPQLFRELGKRNYIMMRKPHQLLSNVEKYGVEVIDIQ